AEEPELLTHDLVSPREYAESVAARRAKHARLAEWTSEPAVPEPPPAYTPMPRELLDTVVNEAGQLEGALIRLGLPGLPYMTSATFWGDDLERIYWDLVWPSLKYEGGPQ